MKKTSDTLIKNFNTEINETSEIYAVLSLEKEIAAQMNQTKQVNMDIFKSFC